MEKFNGTVFQGEMEQKGFYLTQVKHISTASTLSIEQLTKMMAYLGAQNDTCTITVNDQIPILLHDGDIRDLLNDLDGILGQLHE